MVVDAKTFDARKSMQFVEGAYKNMNIIENTENDTFSKIKAVSLINPHEVNSKIKKVFKIDTQSIGQPELAGFYKGTTGHASKKAMVDSPVVPFTRSERPLANATSDVVFKTQH